MSYSRTDSKKVISRIILYDDPSSKTLDLPEIKSFIRNFLGDVDVVIRDNVTSLLKDGEYLDEAAAGFAKIKVRDISNPNIDFEPLYGEVEFEKRILKQPHKNITGVLYDGFQLMFLFQTMIPKNEWEADTIHIIYTNRLFGTFEDDKRYHARVIICGHPSLISTSGVVEAPAKPKEFYKIKRGYQTLGSDVLIEEIKEKFKGQFIDYDDERLTEVVKGYTMQAIFYHLENDPFCNDKRCRLYNAHWQAEVITAQLSQMDFCERHEKILAQYRERKQSPLAQ